MQKFTFTEKKDLLIPNNNTFSPPLDANGQPLSGDELIKTFAKIVDKFETDNNRPVPIQDQRFISWLKQAAKLLNEGKSSEEIFKRTIATSRI